MKALFYRYNSICEPDIMSAFGALGVTLHVMDWEVTHKDTETYDLVQMVSEFLMDNPVDFVFSVNYYPFLSHLCNYFHIRYFSWSVDSPLLELFDASITNEWNRTFLFCKAQVSEIAPLNPGRVFHLPLAGNVAAKEQLFRETSAEQQAQFAHEVAFVGSLYREKSPYNQVQGLSERTRGYLEGIMAGQEEVYGSFFLEEILSDDVVREFAAAAPDFYRGTEGTFLTDKKVLAQMYLGYKITENERYHLFDRLSRDLEVSLYTGSDTSSLKFVHNHGFCQTLTEMPLVFKNSKININTTAKSIRSGIPQRVFDILASGGFCISSYQPELAEFFNIGSEVVTYSSYEEADALCHYYLEHESERVEIAHNALEAVRSYHTFEARLQLMLEAGFAI